MNREIIQFACGPETIAAVFFVPNAGSDPGPCLILCHGAFEYKENFFELAEVMAAGGISSLVLDMPGHGQSTGKRYHIDIDLWVRAISCGIDWLEGRPDVAPHSIGAFGFSSGGTAVFEAALADKRIKALITLDATVKNYLGVWDTLIFKILNMAGIVKRKLFGADLRLNIVRELKKAAVAHDPAVNQAVISDPQIVAAYSAFPLPGAAPTAFVDTINRLNRISVPTLILHGEKDEIDPPETARLIFNTLTCEKALEMLPDSGHCGHLDTRKDEMMGLARDWAAKHL